MSICVMLPSAGKGVDQHKLSPTVNEHANWQKLLIVYSYKLIVKCKDGWSYSLRTETFTLSCVLQYTCTWETFTGVSILALFVHMNNYGNQLKNAKIMLVYSHNYTRQNRITEWTGTSFKELPLTKFGTIWAPK